MAAGKGTSNPSNRTDPQGRLKVMLSWWTTILFLMMAPSPHAADQFDQLAVLSQAFKNRDVVVASRILGGDIDLQQEFAWPLIVVAANHRHLGLIREIIASGADLDASNTNGDTALIIAAYKDYPEVVELLASHGASPDLRGDDGASALIWAARKGHREVARILLARGAKADLGIEPGVLFRARAKLGLPSPGNTGSTALILAAEKGDLAMVELLLAAGADPNLTDISCRSAQELARQGKWDGIATALQEHGAVPAPRCRHAERLRIIEWAVLGLFVTLLAWEAFRKQPGAAARALGYLVNLPLALLFYEAGDALGQMAMAVPLANVLVLLFQGRVSLIKVAILINWMAMAAGILAVFADFGPSNPMLMLYILAALLVAGIQWVNIRVLRAQPGMPRT